MELCLEVICFQQQSISLDREDTINFKGVKPCSNAIISYLQDNNNLVTLYIRFLNSYRLFKTK